MFQFQYAAAIPIGSGAVYIIPSEDTPTGYALIAVTTHGDEEGNLYFGDALVPQRVENLHFLISEVARKYGFGEETEHSILFCPCYPLRVRAKYEEACHLVGLIIIGDWDEMTIVEDYTLERRIVIRPKKPTDP